MQYKVFLRILNEVKMSFKKDNIFWTFGNNDLEHNEPCLFEGHAPFHDYKSSTDRAYANAFIEAGIVNNDLK